LEQNFFLKQLKSEFFVQDALLTNYICSSMYNNSNYKSNNNISFAVRRENIKEIYHSEYQHDKAPER